MFKEFDHSQKGLRKVLREYEELALQYLWEVGENGAHSGPVWKAVSKRLPQGKKVSRTSIFLFLDRLTDEGVLAYREATGKGGRRMIFYPMMSERDFVKRLSKKIIESLLSDFPEITKGIMQDSLSMNV